MFLSNITIIKPINKFALYVDKENIPAIKCYEKCGFEIKELVKDKAYLMETN
jgi:ribosomal protein S18 acetylase RimI-like enzyme